MRLVQFCELVDFQQGTSAHRHIKTWKRYLKGTIVTTIDGIPITKYKDITDTVSKACQELKKQVKIEFGSIVGFAMSGEGISTFQADQLNVIAHHIYSIQTKHNLWSNKAKWPKKMNNTDVIEQEIHISKLQQRKLKLQSDWRGLPLSEWKQINQYNKLGIIGALVK